MAIKFGRTGSLGGAIKCLVFGPAGIGKTTLCATAPTPLIITSENGLLSVKDSNLPYMEIENITDLREAFNFVSQSADASGFETICIDSISDIANTILVDKKKETKDPRQAYGTLSDDLTEELKKWRHLPGKNVYVTCQQERVQDEVTAVTSYAPVMPGRALTRYMPYWGDELLALRLVVDESGTPERRLQCRADIQYYAKDRSGKLELYEPPNLTHIFNKIKGV